MPGTFPATFTPTFPSAAPTTTPGGWNGLLTILAEARQAAEEANTPPVDCPNDGMPLETGPDGGLYCPFDSWRPAGLPPTGASSW